MRRPWFPFYVDDFETSGRVRVMSAAERGSYLSLLSYQWREGFVPAEMVELARICGEQVPAMRRHWKRLESCFPIGTDGKRRNPRQETERRKADALSAKQSAKAKLRQSPGKSPADAGLASGSDSAGFGVSSTQVTDHTPPPGGGGGPPPPPDPRLTPEGQQALTDLCRAAQHPEALEAEVRMILDGGRPGVPSDPAAVSLALHDLRLAGGRVTGTVLRSFVRRAADGATGGRHPDAQLAALDRWAKQT